ncbi:multidrug effflux MFS transporter [Roseobacteraceae bacterium NS-SX3]
MVNVCLSHYWSQTMHPTKHPSGPEFIAMATVLMATIALSIDVMLPALGEMASEFGVESNQRQMVIVALFVGLAVGQLVFGPMSDSIGRRPAITIGAIFFAVGGLICAMATTFETLIAGRLLQGAGAAGPRIVTVALIRDRFEGAAMARVMSIIMGIFIMVPVLAPSLGQALLLVMPWRGLFTLLSVVCVCGALWLLVRQPETILEKRSLRIRSFLAGIFEVLADRRAMAFTVAGGLCYGALMGYINSSQQLFQETYEVGTLYAVLFGFAALFISGATLTNARLVKRFAMDRICVLAVSALIVWSLGFLAVMIVLGDLPGLWLFMVANCPALFLLGLTFGNFNAIALERLGHIAGLAAAVTASVLTMVGVIAAGAIGFSYNETLFPIFFGYVVCGAVALALMLLPSARLAQTPPSTT